MDETTLVGHNVLHVKTSDSYNCLHRGMGESKPHSQQQQQQQQQQPQETTTTIPSIQSYESIGLNLEEPPHPLPNNERTALLLQQSIAKSSTILKKANYSFSGLNDTIQYPSSFSVVDEQQKNPAAGTALSFESRWLETVQVVFTRCLQPPVVGALLGMFVASMPQLRGMLVDLKDRSGHAPMQWLFDGLYAVGESAVPINMMILGSNLSASFSKNNNKDKYKDNNSSRNNDDFSPSTMIAIVVGKMIVMPIIGFLSAYLLKIWWWQDHIPDDIGGSFYLVIMIVFLTPTANNVMVMVELSGNNNSGHTNHGSTGSGQGGGGGCKEAMARIIAWQYAVSPLILSLTMTVAVCIAVQWS